MSRIAARAVIERRETLEMAAKRCESPIEELLFLALVAEAEYHVDSAVIVNGQEPAPFDGWSVAVVSPQYVVGKYRADFVVSLYDTNPIYDRPVGGEIPSKRLGYEWKKGVVLVEVDGHDFHERTKEQASHDKKKDRDLQAAGFTIYRFTGSDVWNRPMECAKEVVAAAERNCENSAAIEITQGEDA